MTSNFLIGPIKEGLRKDTKPWATPEDSFSKMINAYQWRGRIERRQGYNLLGRLQIQNSFTAGTFFLTAGGINLITDFGLSASFSVVPGTINIVVVTQGTVYTDPNKDGTLLATGGTGTGGTINYLTGQIQITAGGGSTISGSFYYAQNLPVMGLKTQEGFSLTTQTLIAFDTTQAYKWNGTNFIQLPSVMPVTWSGTNYQFFFTTNYAGAFWATNFKSGLNGVAVTNAVAGIGITTITTAVNHGFTSGQTVALVNLGGLTDVNGNTYVITVTGVNTFTIPFQTTKVYTANGIALNSQVAITGQDGIKYYGALTTGNSWANYNPPLNQTTALSGALMIFPYRGYLVFLNTWEGNDQGVFNFENRARWTQIGTPYYSSPVPTLPTTQGIDPNAARDDLFGRGGANDAPTNEAIVSAGFIRDILVVYFERSTWRLRFVNNAQNPFVWERVNIELGSDCTFSAIPFDKGLMAIGNRGIVISDANDTHRFDEKIPDDIFNIRQNNNGLSRVYGIRTFRSRLNYWTFPSDSYSNGTFPDQVLVFNYDTANWSFFDDCFTCFGYYYPSGTGYTWAQLTDPWSSYTTVSWDSGISESGYENIIAGNQQGYVLRLEQGMVNSPSLSISGITDSSITLANAVFTSTNHNLQTGYWVTLSGIIGVTSSDGVSLNGRNFKVAVIDANTFNLSEFKAIPAGNAAGTSFNYTISYQNILTGSCQINIGNLVFTDPAANGILVGTGGVGGSGTINYSTGAISLTFNSAIGATAVFIRVVSLDPNQGVVPIKTLGTYTGGGQIAKISGIDLQTKIFNFFKDDKRSRLSRIDFYTESTANGQFTCNVWADSSNDPINTPLGDNPQSNVVLTSPNPYQIGQGDESIFRLYADCLAQTVQLQFTLSDAQLAVNSIAQSNIAILAMNISMRQGGRLV